MAAFYGAAAVPPVFGGGCGVRQSNQWIHGWDARDGTGELEPGAHGGGYRNTFSGIKGGWTQ
jgi:hypothetical protein